MDIGSAKPTVTEQQRVPHHGLDLVDVNQPFSVGEYLSYAASTVEQIFARNRNVLVVGGSGFYLKSFYAPVTDEWEISPELRREVEQLEETAGLPGLVRALQEKHSGERPPIDLCNPRRVKNALLRCLASGRTLPQLKAAFQQRGTPFDRIPKRFCLLMRDHCDLDQRIELRVREMIAAGLIEETRNLLSAGILQNPSASRAIGYRETINWILGQATDTELLIDEICLHTRQFVKKQLAWFRRQFPSDQILWIDPGTSAAADNLFTSG